MAGMRIVVFMSFSLMPDHRVRERRGAAPCLDYGQNQAGKVRRMVTSCFAPQLQACVPQRLKVHALQSSSKRRQASAATTSRLPLWV